MTIDSHHMKDIDGFFAAIAPVKEAYRQDTFAYVAVRQGDAFHLVQGAWHMNPVPARPPFGTFKSENIRAGRVLCTDMKIEPRQFLERLLEGRIKTPDGELVFAAGNEGRLSTHFAPIAPEGLQGQTRIAILSLTGAHHAPLLRQPDLDWELKSHSTPYDNFQELMADYQVGALRNQAVNVDIVAFSIAAIDQSSTVSGETATLAVQLSHGLSPAKTAIRYRLLTADNPIERNSIAGGELTWRNDIEYQVGMTTRKVPKGAYIHCTATYDSMGMNHRWITDPTNSPNTRRVAYEIYDKKMEKIREIITREQSSGSKARDIESVAAWVLWMLGFSVAHLNLPNTSDAPDLLAVTPSGNYAVVECTTGLLRADGKLANLQARAQELRRVLDMSGNGFVRILPVIVTTKLRNDVASEMEQAERNSILVLTREDIERALDRAYMIPNAEQIFAEGKQTMNANLAKYSDRN